MRKCKKALCLLLSLVLTAGAVIPASAEERYYFGYKLKTTWITPEMYEQIVNTLISHADETATVRMPLYDTGIVCPEGVPEDGFDILMSNLLPIDLTVFYDNYGMSGDLYSVTEDIVNEEENRVTHYTKIEYGTCSPYGRPSLHVGFKSGTNPAEQAELLRNCLINVKAIVAAAPQSEDPMAKVQFFFEHLCRNASYGSTDDNNNYHSANTLVKGTGVCSGYSGALWLLSLYAGIDATYLSIKSMRHAAVAYPLDGRYVIVDATWGDQKKIDYRRFGFAVSDEWNNYLLDPNWNPEQPAAKPYS